MEQGLQPSETTSFFAPSRIEHYRVVPLKLALKQLELKLSQVSLSVSFVTCIASALVFFPFGARRRGPGRGAIVAVDAVASRPVVCVRPVLFFAIFRCLLA